jgi:hypothetical protein
MKRLICLLAIISTTTIYAQKISLPMDSLQTLLCSKWETSYALEGSMRIDMAPGAPKMTLEFRKDKTFISTSDKSTEISRGTWAYDANKQLIKLTINGKSIMSIVSLTADELSMVVDTKAATPDDPTLLTVVYKIKGK